MTQNRSSLTLSRSELGSCLVHLALRYNGVREQPLGSNSGPLVRHFQAATTLARTQPTGWPWCAAFDAFIMQELWRELGIQLPNPWPATASCDELLYWARKQGILFNSPEAFDFFLAMKSAGDATHTGLVMDVQSDSDIETIEGNTNNDGSREGIGVFTFVGGNAKHEANRTYVRWLNLLPEEIPILPPSPTPLLVAEPPSLTSPSRPETPRLILALPPYSPADYHVIQTAQFAGGAWTVEGSEIQSILGESLNLPAHHPALTKRDRIRAYLLALGQKIDEKRTMLGNHLGDDDPRQYVFVASN